MRTLILALLPTLLVACGDDGVALTSDTGDASTVGPGSTEPTSDPTMPSTDPTMPTTSPGTTVGSSVGSDTATVTSATITDPTVSTVTSDATISTISTSDTTSDTGTTSDTSTTTDTSTTGTGTTGGVMGCGMDGPQIDANLVHLGVDPGCGPIEFIGTNMSDSSGPVYALDGCPCGANCLKPDPWTLTLDMPLDWLPGKLPACPRIVVERQKSKQGCELVGFAVWDSQAPNALADFHAGSLLGPIAAAKAELKVEQLVAEECDCDNCCSTPTRLDLKFSIAQKSGTLAEGEELSLGGGEGDVNGYAVKNFQSHLSGICDDSPHIDWAMRKLPPAP